MKKILVSSCLLGEKVRYDGKNKPLTHEMLTTWQQQGRVIAICPEVSGGLPVPRTPAEIRATDRRVITRNGVDVTQEFILGAERALALCQKYDIQFALLKESSPSCGSRRIYDGTFSGEKVNGKGICSAHLIENGIRVFSEESIDKLVAALAIVDA